MGKFTFDDDDDQEPTFSFHEFMKWMADQGQPVDESNEPVAPINESTEAVHKEEMKKKFKDNFKKKLQKRKKKT